MLRKKKDWAVVAFHTTADAFHLEAAARAQGFAGRLIPVPREITAGCGLAWRDEPAREEALRALLAREGIAWETIRILTL